MSVRDDLASAASEVEDITAHPFYVQGTRAGHAYIRRDRVEYPDKFGSVGWWNVVVVLPSDQAKAEMFLEDHLPLLRAALAPHMTVTEAVPQRLNIPGVGDLLCVFINGHREE